MQNFLNLFKDRNNNPNLQKDGLGYLEIQLTSHCNMTCVSCTHFSPLAKEEFLEPEIFEKDIIRLKELTGGNIKRISLMGGEPLLHKNCTKFFYISRKHLPDTIIQFVTNGILLNFQKDDFWQAMKENDIFLRPTLYPIKVDWRKVNKKVKEYNIKFRFFNDYNYKKVSVKIPIVPKGKLNKDKMFRMCTIRHCPHLLNGKIYPCSIAANIRHLIGYFELEMKDDPKNGIDIYKVRNFKQIYNFLNKPISLCANCNIEKTRVLGLWRLGKRQKEEWI